MNRILYKGIRAKLAGDATVNGFVSGKYYRQLAPYDASYPFVTIAHSAGGNTNTEPDDMVDMRFTIKAMSTSLTVASQIAEAIYSALHNQTLTYDTPYKHLDCEHLVPFEYVENVDNDKVWHIGGVYRIRADKT